MATETRSKSPVIPESEKAKGRPENILIFTDIGRDPDDMAALVLGKSLVDSKHITIAGVIATTTPARKRAELTRFTLDEVGLPDIPVAEGSNLPTLEIGHIHPYEFRDLPDQYREAELQKSQQLTRDILENAADNSLNILIIAAFTDCHRFIKSSPDAARLFKRKVKHVTIMGGVQTEGDEVALDSQGFIKPDKSYNYNCDTESSTETIKYLQEQQIPVTFVSRYAAHAAQLPVVAYDQFEQTGNPVGRILKGINQEVFEVLWATANLPADDPRRTLAPHFNRTWFQNIFCKGQEIDLQEGESIFPHVQGVNVFDPLALLSVSRTHSREHFNPTTVRTNGIEHTVIGITPNNSGVKNPDSLRGLLTSRLTKALQ